MIASSKSRNITTYPRKGTETQAAARVVVAVEITTYPRKGTETVPAGMINLIKSDYNLSP